MKVAGFAEPLFMKTRPRGEAATTLPHTHRLHRLPPPPLHHSWRFGLHPSRHDGQDYLLRYVAIGDDLQYIGSGSEGGDYCHKNKLSDCRDLRISKGEILKDKSILYGKSFYNLKRKAFWYYFGMPILHGEHYWSYWHTHASVGGKVQSLLQDDIKKLKLVDLQSSESNLDKLLLFTNILK